MIIVTWNCNGAFRNKFEILNKLHADILVIQECENPEHTKDKKYKEWAGNYLWVGTNKHKGLGVFVKNGIKIKKLDWPDSFNGERVNFFIPCLINNKYRLLAVWNHFNNSTTYAYIGQFWKYFQVNQSNFKKMIIAGDFNSNAIWDKPKRNWNHSDIVKELDKIKIISVYHTIYNEAQGVESTPTFYLQKNLQKPYHIDYFFVQKDILKKTLSFKAEAFEDWKAFSDHVPLVLNASI